MWCLCVWFGQPTLVPSSQAMVAEKDRLLFKRLAVSLAPFAASQPTFKIIADESRISCDPAEILEAHDPGDSLPVALLREAVGGIAHFGRRAQARLVLLSAAILDELPQVPLCALRRAGDLADTALQKLVQDQTAVSETVISGDKAPALETSFDDLLLDKISDDVSWFFSSDADENSNLTIADANPPVAKADLDIVDAPIASKRPVGELLCSVSQELCRRCSTTSLDKSGSGAGEQCFVYGRIRPVQPQMILKEGIVCHVPHSYIAARSNVLAKLVDTDANLRVFKTLFLDADLTSSAYASCAPAQRRLNEQLLQSTEPSFVTTGVPPVNARVLFASEERDKLLVEHLYSLKSRGFEAIMLSGDFSEVVASSSCDIGLIVAGGIPARLIHALAADCGAEVLHGLPDLTERFSRWEAKRAIHFQLRDLLDDERKKCFCYPLVGRRQAILPEVSSPDGFWEVWAWADGTVMATTACTVLLEASCEPQLRQSFAELSDSVLKTLECLKHPEVPPDSGKELPCDWMLQVAGALEEAATSETCPLLAVEEQAPLIAPWVIPLGDAAGDRAACESFAAGLRRVASMEEECAEIIEVPLEDIKEARAILRRASRLVQMLSRVSCSWKVLRDPSSTRQYGQQYGHAVWKPEHPTRNRSTRSSMHIGVPGGRWKTDSDPIDRWKIVPCLSTRITSTWIEKGIGQFCEWAGGTVFVRVAIPELRAALTCSF